MFYVRGTHVSIGVGSPMTSASGAVRGFLLRNLRCLNLGELFNFFFVSSGVQGVYKVRVFSILG